MPASSRPFRNVMASVEGSTRSAPLSTRTRFLLDLRTVRAHRLYRGLSASLLVPSVAAPGLLERVALLLGSIWVVVYAQRLRRTLSVNRHEFERNLVAA